MAWPWPQANAKIKGLSQFTRGFPWPFIRGQATISLAKLLNSLNLLNLWNFACLALAIARQSQPNLMRVINVASEIDLFSSSVAWPWPYAKATFLGSLMNLILACPWPQAQAKREWNLLDLLNSLYSAGLALALARQKPTELSEFSKFDKLTNLTPALPWRWAKAKLQGLTDLYHGLPLALARRSQPN